ncbi:MAG: pyruvate formate lyase family protein [Candidatus Brocadiia bacterium]|jgi:formate C-acetyltransferase
MYDLAAIQEIYLSAPEEAVFLERARILQETKSKFAGAPPGVRQGKIIQELCDRISVVVSPADVLLGRILEQVPGSEDEKFVQEHPELFLEAGAPGWLDSDSLYIPDWNHLLEKGLQGLAAEVEARRRAADGRAADARELEDMLQGISLSLSGISRLAIRYAEEARRVAGGQEDPEARARLLRAADCCSAIARRPPESLHEALQLFILFHMVLSCLVGGRDVTPGRMDQCLRRFYESDLAGGKLTRDEAVELLAVMMTMLPQMAGRETTGLLCTKRTPNRNSHYYITVGGITAEGESAVNDLSAALLAARRLVKFPEPTLSVRYWEGIDRGFWTQAVRAMRDSLPVFAYNDDVVIAALTDHGTAERGARDYAHCACLNCFIPGDDLPPLRENYNVPLLVLSAMNQGRSLETDEQIGAATPAAREMIEFDDFFAAFRAQLRFALDRVSARLAHVTGPGYPLPARCLFKGQLDEARSYRDRHDWYSDQHMVGVATTIDSLLAIRQVVYREKRISLEAFRKMLASDFDEQEAFRQYLRQRVPSYGSDDADVLEMIRRVAEAWCEEVERSGAAHGIRLRPSFYSWLYNIEMGKSTPATPDGRPAGEPLSSGQTPSQGNGRAPTEVLRSMAQLAHRRTCSGGTTFRINPSHFKGERGVERLRALIETYFALGGLHIQFIPVQKETLLDAVQHPEKHRDLMIRVTGFSARFVELPPDAQQEIIQRAEYA